MLTCHAELAQSLNKNLHSDLADEMAEVEAGVKAALSAMGQGEGHASIKLTARSAMERFRQGEDNFGPPNLDEFGRDLNLQKK